MPGFDKVVEDMATYGKKFAGGKFQLKYAAKFLDKGNILKFEVSNLSNNLTRIYDIQVEFFEKGQRFIKNLELKNSGKFYPETIKNQFIKDLQKMDNLGDIQWIFRKTANIADMTTLKNGVLQALKKADGKPIEELERLFDNRTIVKKLQTIFGKEVKTLNDLLNKLNDDKIFNQIFEIVE